MPQRSSEAEYFWKIDRWNGGYSEDSRTGLDGAFRFAIGCDIRSDSGLLQVARKPVRHDLGGVTTEVDWIEPNPLTSEVYYYGGGIIYKEDAGVTSIFHTLDQDEPNGQGLCDFDKFLYYRSATRLGRYNYETQEFDDDWQLGLTSCPKWSPMCGVKNVLLVGHGRFIGTVDDVGFWTPERLTLPPGYNCRSIFRSGSFAIILATRGTAITDSEQGLAFVWDTTSINYNDYIPLDGNPHAGISHKNKIIIIAGQETTIQESLGGQTQIVQTIPNIGDGKTAEVYPGAIDMWRNMVHFGISDGTSATVTRALYNWGAKNFKFQDALNSEFPTSVYDNSNLITDLLGTSVQITACKKIGTTLRFAWKSGSTYGVDQIDTTQYLNRATYRSLAFDRYSPYIKTAYKLIGELAKSLAAGESIITKISPDPYGDPTLSLPSTLSQTYNTVGSKLIEMPLTALATEMRSRDLHNEIQLIGTGATRPAMKRVWTDIIEDPDQL